MLTYKIKITASDLNKNAGWDRLVVSAMDCSSKKHRWEEDRRRKHVKVSVIRKHRLKYAINKRRYDEDHFHASVFAN